MLSPPTPGSPVQSSLGSKQSHYTLLAIKALKGINSDDKELGHNLQQQAGVAWLTRRLIGWWKQLGLWLVDTTAKTSSWRQSATLRNIRQVALFCLLLLWGLVTSVSSQERKAIRPGRPVAQTSEKDWSFRLISSLLNFLIDQLILKSFERVNQY